jgi:hypothetical protein
MSPVLYKSLYTNNEGKYTLDSPSFRNVLEDVGSLAVAELVCV